MVDFKNSLVDISKRILLNMGSDHGPCLASDCWTSKARRGYFGVYLSFISRKWEMVGLPIGLCRLTEESKTGPVLAGKLKECLENFGIVYTGCVGGNECAHSDPKHTTADTRHCVFADTTDSGGSDPTAASMAACNAVRCLPHCINTVYRAAVETPEEDDSYSEALGQCIAVIEKVTAVARAYRASTKLSDALHKKQKQVILDLQNPSSSVPHVLKLPCITRWGSTYDAITRFLEPIVLQAVRYIGVESISDDTAASAGNLPTQDEEKILRELVRVLEPLKIVTVKMQGEKFVTMSCVYPHVCYMLHSLRTMAESNDLHTCSREFASHLHEQMAIRLSSQFVRASSLVATILDPRFKRMRTVPPEMACLAKDYLRSAAFTEHASLSAADAVDRQAAAALKPPNVVVDA